jgi:PiT family inorganic phosphate transporter
MDQGLAYQLAIATIVIVLIFDYTNGFHDASNIIGTIIASRAMTPIQSVIIVATFEFLGPLLGGTAVANTIGKFITLGDVPPMISTSIIFAGMFGAIFWNLLTWWIGLPSSSSHALVGGLAGAVMLSVGSDHVVWGFQTLMTTGKLDGVTKVVASLILSPIIGFWAGFLIHKIMGLLLRPASPRVNKVLKGSQFLTAAGLSFSHGANDAQKSMGIVTLVLLLSGQITEFVVPFWVILACAIAITCGILSGGWRIVRTVGFGIYKVRPMHALDTQLTAATVILTASVIGAPVSTTHVVSTAIMGIGSADAPKKVRWAKAKEIVSTWLITIPSAGLVSAGMMWVVQQFIH